ncbi:hypothetical protein Misp06_02569 [Microbulbifer sp. NBRC 101763]|uniref:Carboxypeptidase regulatory-like domain-containing protein n=3 Tax=Microbulbifer TaxID=48073 RepID=A0ABV4P287_9GAMM|nr:MULTISPECIES: hypothetical protein [Microbulbifer]WHI52399.1 hypothetical protein P3339_06355 [Microbulbifer sp. MLAF003]
MTAVNKVLEGRVLTERTRSPKAGLDLYLLRLNEPVMSMQSWDRIATARSDRNGRFSFNISEAGPYELRWKHEADAVEHELHIGDFDTKKQIEVIYSNKERKVFPWAKDL